MRTFTIAALTFAAQAIRLQSTPTAISPFGDATDVDLYGNMRHDLKDVILKADKNQDGYTTVKEFMEVMGTPNAEDIFVRYGSDEAMMWWKDASFLRDATQHIVDSDYDGFVSYDELSGLLNSLGIFHLTQQIIDVYAQDKTRGLDMGEMVEFWHDWAYASGKFPTGDSSQGGGNEHGLEKYTEDELYGGMRDDMKSHVLKVDLDKDGYGSLKEFLTIFNQIEVEQLMQEYGSDYMWWKDGHFMQSILSPMFDQDKDGLLTLEELTPILEPMISQDSIEPVFNEYASEPAQGLTQQELAYIIHDWGLGQLKGEQTTFTPSWADWSHEELYGGMLKKWPEIIQGMDQNQDGIVPLEEFLQVTGSPNKEQVLEKYDRDHMWWKDGACLRDGLTHMFDWDQNQLYSYDEMMMALGALGVTSGHEAIFKRYSSDVTQPLDGETFAKLLEDWAFGLFESDFEQYIIEIMESLASIKSTLDPEMELAVQDLPETHQHKFMGFLQGLQTQSDRADTNLTMLLQKINATMA